MYTHFNFVILQKKINIKTPRLPLPTGYNSFILDYYFNKVTVGYVPTILPV